MRSPDPVKHSRPPLLPIGGKIVARALLLIVAVMPLYDLDAAPPRGSEARMGLLQNWFRRIAERPAPVFGALGERLDEAKETDFFRWFHFEQVAQTAAADRTVTEFRPSGDAFRPLVLLQVTTDRQGRMAALRLAIRRSFIDDPKTSVFARDLAKSFLRSAIPAADQGRIADLANEIEFDRRGATVLMRRQELPRLPAEPTPGYATFLGRSERFALPLSRTRLELQNENAADGPALVLSLEPAQ